MFFKYSILIISAFALCLMIISAKAQTAEEDRQSVAADQQALDDAYKQLQKDRQGGNTARVEADEENIEAAQQDFQMDEQHTIEDDQEAVSADLRALERLSQQLQQDQMGNTGAVAADEKSMAAAQQKLQADKRQTVADDKLEVTSDQQALDNENSRLQQDLQGKSNIAGATDSAGTAKANEENITQMTMTLKHAQMKLLMDSSSQGPPH
jgi:hypothetical protein